MLFFPNIRIWLLLVSLLSPCDGASFNLFPRNIGQCFTIKFNLSMASFYFTSEQGRQYLISLLDSKIVSYFNTEFRLTVRQVSIASLSVL